MEGTARRLSHSAAGPRRYTVRRSAGRTVPAIKTAISLPEPLLDRMEALSRDMRLPRSQVVALALEEFLDRHRSRQLLAQLNEVYAGEMDDEDRALLRGWKQHHRELVTRDE